MAEAWITSDRRTDTVVGTLRAALDRHPDRLFLDFQGDTYTYADIWERATDLARGLRAAGVGEGHVVVSMLDNNLDAVLSWFASNVLGAIWAPTNTALKGDSLRHVVGDTGARIVLCEPDFVARFELVQDDLPGVRLFSRGAAEVPDGLKLECNLLEELRVAGGGDEWFTPSPDDTTCLIYTGGTTGPSKAGVVSHAYMANLAHRTNQALARTAEDVNWSPLPMFHMNLPGCTILGAMLVGGRAAIYPRFSVSNFWPEIHRSGATVANLVGAMPAMIARMPDNPDLTACKGQLRALWAAPVSPDDQRIWQQRFGVPAVGANSYGLGEAVPITCYPVGADVPAGSSGKRNEDDFDVRIFDDDDNELGPNEVGEVVVRPRRPNVMIKGYWRRPDTMAAMTRNLWYHTGDLARFDEDGFFYFVDRKKDYLRRRGENISSQEQEKTYLQHPDIVEVAVHAVLSDLAEDDVKVTAVLSPGAGLTPEELFAWAADRVPYFALPRYIEFRDELPKSEFNRVLKYKLREEGCTPTTWDREVADVEWERR
ncbi:MAG: AMP-binding protein [Actinobacteria bacterium]|nr:AMP-binding protein [Actinomycetota bacterium]